MQEKLETYRKRVLMRAQHRGIKEMDIILGGYVIDNIENFNESDLGLLERFMQINDQKLYQMVLGNEPVGAEYKDLIVQIRAHINFDVNS